MNNLEIKKNALSTNLKVLANGELVTVLKNVSSGELITELKNLVSEERKLLSLVLDYL
ncbi:MAG: hypothetical protein IPM57_09685 [Oligoflexia bacterium]|nr:hypothetical protein [Oligoflexia bacterium]